MEDKLVGVLPEEFRQRWQDLDHCLRCQAELDPDRPLGHNGQEYLGPMSRRYCTRECEISASARRFYYHLAKPAADDEHVMAAGCIRAKKNKNKRK